MIRWRIRYQLLLPLAMLLLGVMGISTWSGLASAHRARQQIVQNVQNVGRTLSEANFPLNEPVLNSMKRLSGADYVLVDETGRVASGGRASTLQAQPDELPPADVVVDQWQALALGPPVVVGGEKYLGSGVRLRQGGTLYILYPEALWRDALWEAIRPALVLGLCGGLASLGLAIAVARGLSRRITELERRTRLIAAGDFSPMPLPRRNDELRDLGQSVNDMAQKLAQLQESLQRTERLRLLGQVGGGLAHQLRNGVTGARLAIQLHVQECDGPSPETLEVALRQLTLIEANLKRFLDLGRNENLQRQPCRLSEVIEEAVALLRPQARHAHIDLRWQPPATEILVAGDRERLGHLFLNLITNAVEAVGADGWIEVTLNSQDPQWCTAEVIDSGPGPPPAIADRLFQPFTTGKREGIGLGLAVARQVALAHDGSLNWRRESDCTCFQIKLPKGTGQA